MNDQRSGGAGGADALTLTLSNIKTYYLVSGIANGIVFLLGTFWVLIAGVATCGLGCLLIVIPLVNLAGMVLDFIALTRSGGAPSSKLYSFLRFVAIFDIICWAIVPVIMGILNLQNLGKPEVYEYFHRPAATA